MRFFRWRRRAAPPPQVLPPPAWHYLVSPTFRLVSFGAIACYVELLVAEGHSLAGAVVAAIAVAFGTWVSTVGPFGSSASARA
jgi:hypothetical protein